MPVTRDVNVHFVVGSYSKWNSRLLYGKDISVFDENWYWSKQVPISAAHVQWNGSLCMRLLGRWM